MQLAVCYYLALVFRPPPAKADSGYWNQGKRDTGRKRKANVANASCGSAILTRWLRGLVAGQCRYRSDYRQVVAPAT